MEVNKQLVFRRKAHDSLLIKGLKIPAARRADRHSLVLNMGEGAVQMMDVARFRYGEVSQEISYE